MMELIRFEPTQRECWEGDTFDIHTDIEDKHYHLRCQALSLGNDASLIQALLDEGNLEWITTELETLMHDLLTTTTDTFVIAVDVAWIDEGRPEEPADWVLGVLGHVTVGLDTLSIAKAVE